MALMHNLKKFFMKEDFDFERDDIDLDMFHPQLRLCFLPMGVFFKHRDSKLRFIWPITSILINFAWVGLQVYSVYYGFLINDIYFVTECFFYCVIFGVVPLVQGGLMINREYVWRITNEMNKDFLEICKTNNRHRKHFLDKQLTIWKLFFGWITVSIFTSFWFIGAAVLPVLFFNLFGAHDKYFVRPLIFPVKLPYSFIDDVHATPCYETILCWQIYMCFLFIQTFPVCIYFEFHILLHYSIKLDIVAKDIMALFEDLDPSTATLPRSDNRRIGTECTRILSQRMRVIVDQHLSVFEGITTLSTVVGAPLAYQIFVGAVCMCLIMYQIECKLNDGVLDMRFIMMFCCHCCQLGILCFLGTVFQTKADTVGYSCYECGWELTPLGQLVKQDILIVLLRSQQPLSIKFTGLPQLSLETYYATLMTAYTYFNMLRQADF